MPSAAVLLAVSAQNSKRWGEVIEVDFAKIKTNSDQSCILATLKDTMQPKLLRGDLPVATGLATMESSA